MPISSTTPLRPLEARLLQNSNVALSSKELAILVIGPITSRVEEIAAGLTHTFDDRGKRKTARQSPPQLATINARVLAFAGVDAGIPVLSERDLSDLDDVLPYEEAAGLLREMCAEGMPAVLAERALLQIVPFWKAAGQMCGVDVTALLVVSSPHGIDGGAPAMLSWLQSMLLAEQATRGMTHRKVVIDDSGIGVSGADIADWLDSTWNVFEGAADRVMRFPGKNPGCAEPHMAAPYAVTIGFNSWVRRCEAAFRQMERLGENDAVHGEFDRLRAQLDAALALFGPMLGEGRVTAERLRLQNDRLRIERDEFQRAGVTQGNSVGSDALKAEIEMLKARSMDREAELTAARGDLDMLRAWCDDVGSRSALAHARLLDTRLKLGLAKIANERTVQALISQGERQLRVLEKPLARWIARQGWGFKAAQRLARHLAIVENFLDELPWPLVGVHPDGRRRRILSYLTGATDFLSDFPIVQDLEYVEMYPDVAQSGMKPLVHFILHGQGELRNPHPLFDTAHYLAQCPEAVQLASSPVVHYLRWGKDKGHDPHPLFNTRAYFQRYPDTTELNPLIHWIQNFRNVVDPLFDPQYYLESYSDVADAGRNPMTHYLSVGWREGRNPNPWFDTQYYLANNPQVAREGLNPLVHYGLSGWRLRLRPGPQFDPAFYLASDPRLNDDCDPLRHYIDHGRAEGRALSAGEPASDPDTADLVEISAPRHEAQAPIRASVAVGSTDYVPLVTSSRERRVVLMVEALYPRPDLDSGSLDHVNFARIFQRLGYEVHYLSLLEFGRDHDDRSSHYRTLLEQMGVRCVTAADYAYFEGYYFDVADRLDACFVSRVHFGGMQIESLRRLCPDARIIFNTVDLHFVREEREGTLKNDPALLMRARRTREMELNFAAEADATVVVSSSEKVLLDDLAPDAKTHVVPLIRQFTQLRDDAFSQRRDIAFIGGFNHQPNIDAIEHFLADVWPHVNARRPDIGFRVIGANMPDDWKRRKVAGVTFVGFVDDLDDELAHLRLTVAPLRYGAGAKGKLVSSLAAGVPAVVSAIASEGMGLADGETVVVANNAVDFAEKIILLHDNEALWTKLSHNGSAFIRSHYSIDTGYDIMRGIFAQIGITPPVDTKNAG